MACFAVGIECVLPSDETDVVKDVAISAHEERYGLPALLYVRVGGVVVVLEGHILREEVVGQYIHGGRVVGATGSAGAFISYDDGLACVFVGTAKRDVGLGDGEHFVINTGSDEDDGTVGRRDVDGALDGIVVACAIGGDVERVIEGRNFPRELGSCCEGRKRNEPVRAAQGLSGAIAGCARDGDIGSVRDEIAEAGAERNVGIVSEHVGFVQAVGKDVVESYAQFVPRVETGKDVIAGREDVNIAQRFPWARQSRQSDRAGSLSLLLWLWTDHRQRYENAEWCLSGAGVWNGSAWQIPCHLR